MNKVIEEILTKVEDGVLENNTPKQKKQTFVKRAVREIEKEVEKLLKQIDEVFEDV